MPVAVNSNFYKHPTDTYSKVTVLRRLLAYRRHKLDGTTQSRLHYFRYRYGVQFLIDLFVFTELYMSHYSYIDMVKCREEITYTLKQLPEYRIKYEVVK